MKVFAICFCLLAIFHGYTNASQEITNILEKSTDLTQEELTALRPIFAELQLQYDFIMKAVGSIPDELNTQKLLAYKTSQMELEKYFEQLFAETNQEPQTLLHLDLPRIEDLRLSTPEDMPATEVQQFESKMDDLSGLIERAQNDINALMKLNNQVDRLLLDIDKPKVVAKVYGALKTVYFAATRVTRAAYCTYSYSPLITDSLETIRAGKECYHHTITLLETMKQELKNTLQSISDIAADLKKIFKTISDKKTLKAKVIALVNNFDNIKSDVLEISAVVGDTLDKLQNDLPAAVSITKECGSEFAHSLPTVLYTVRNLTFCITFREELPSYDFMKPEEEYLVDTLHA